MAQPVFIPGTRGVGIKFGNLPLPNGQGNMAWLDLNDRTTWQTDGVSMPMPASALAGAPYLYKGRGAWIADDFAGRVVVVSARYKDSSGVPLGAALPKLYLAGEQQLTFDNGVTAMLAKLATVNNRRALTDFWPFLWGVDLEFRAVDPWFKDIAATANSVNVTALTTVATNFNITYPGSVWCEPIWTFTMQNATVAYKLLKLTNTMSGESILIVPPSYGAGAHSIVIDSAKQQVYFDVPGQPLDPIGSFPMLYGPAGTVNPMSIALSYDGTIIGIPTLAWSFNSRWDL